MNYSIIIPHHNIPKLLKRAIDSIPQREDLEIIVVDDASSPKFKEEIRSACDVKMRNIHLIELEENGGGGRARNAGLDVASGLFVLFLDADDFFNYCINDVLDQYKDTDADIVYFKGNCVDSDSYIVGNRLDYNNKKIDNYLINRSKGEEELRYHFQVPVCKIVRRSVISKYNIRFDETNIRNDVTFAYKLGYYASKIAVDRRAIYCATTREGSVSSFRGADRILTTIDVLGRAVLFFRSIGRGDAGYETSLSHNLYILLRRKDYQSFNKGFEHLQKLGLDRREMEHLFAKRMAETALSSCVWCIAYSPNTTIRWKSFINLFVIAVPSFIKMKIIR